MVLKPPSKVCTKCSKEKSEGAFYLLPSGNRRGECKVCCRRRTRQRYERNPEAWKEEVRKWRAKNPKKVAQYERASRRRRIAKGTENQKVREWREKNPTKWQAQQAKALGRERKKGWPSSAKRRALEHNAFVENVNRTVVLMRDQGLCGICGKSVDPRDFHLDHIRPLSKGGMHEYGNVQIAHPFCNRSKGAKIV